MSQSKKPTVKSTLIPHLRIPNNAKAYTKCLQVATKKTTIAFHVDALETAFHHIKKERGIDIQLNSISIPLQLNSELYEAVENALLDLMYKEFVDPYALEVHNVLAAHGETWEAQMNHTAVLHENEIVLDEHKETTWSYERFHYAFQPKNDDSGFKIHCMSPPELPHFSNSIMEYSQAFELPSMKLYSTDVIIKVLEGEIEVTLQPRSPLIRHSLVVKKYEQVYIRDDLQFSYKITKNGAVVEVIFLNHEITGLSAEALNTKKEASTVEMHEPIE